MTPRRLLPFAVALTAAVAVPAGVAHANRFDADATCETGMAFTMPRGEEGTTIVATVDGRVLTRVTVATHGDAVLISHPNPDPTSTHTWVVTVDSRFNPDQTWSETVGPCVTPTTVTVPTTTVAPVPSTTVGTTPTTVPASSTTTVVTVPRPTPTTSTTVPVGPYRLPDTGPTNTLALYAAATIAFGAVALTLKNWGRK